jgi:hypothetical protein
MRTAPALVSALRLVVAIAIAAAVVGQLVVLVRGGVFRPWDFFGYFTIQSNCVAAVALVAAVVLAARDRPTESIAPFRAAATTYMVTTGAVYNTLLVHVPLGAFGLPWSNDVLHRWVPLVLALDWVFVADRRRMPLRRVWWFLLYPAVWLLVVLVRGATDGWVPYPFLDPRLGYGVVALYCVAVGVFVAAMGLLVLAVTRWRPPSMSRR